MGIFSKGEQTARGVCVFVGEVGVVGVLVDCRVLVGVLVVVGVGVVGMMTSVIFTDGGVQALRNPIIIDRVRIASDRTR